ncbi:hypothetical protein [Actinophytocola gossypii]|uniref:Endonuclease/exonuclease/phosphatase domain-containing protein n=1 Tax=Actinophytocola gossypii TaxID=2812003 RepID=A0ABT2J9C6_9PSEU|nr:hypothetical protein [Actinophytocola gossypii]MCT2584467.1 hypothetical protein [Actinophytocola gossypii]
MANEIRGRVDRELHGQAEVFTSAVGELRAWERTWSARTLKMVNWNIQQGGGGNAVWPRNDGVGTESKDIDGLAARLMAGEVDIATLQEMWKGDAEKLEKALDERAAPGEKWEVHFGKASSTTSVTPSSCAPATA